MSSRPAPRSSRTSVVDDAGPSAFPKSNTIFPKPHHFMSQVSLTLSLTSSLFCSFWTIIIPTNFQHHQPKAWLLKFSQKKPYRFWTAGSHHGSGLTGFPRRRTARRPSATESSHFIGNQPPGRRHQRRLRRLAAGHRDGPAGCAIEGIATYRFCLSGRDWHLAWWPR